MGSQGPVTLEASGPLTVGSLNPLVLTNAPPNARMFVWMSLSSTPVNILGGTIHANPFSNQRGMLADPTGRYEEAAPWPSLPPGTDVWWQFLVEDLSVPEGITLSNAVRSTTP